MNFKEIMEWDAKNIHLNTDENAAPITWDGEEIDAEVIHEGDGLSDDSNGPESVEVITLHVLASLIKRPKVRCSYEFNGAKWMVSRVLPAGPILKIQIFREKS
ncbi:MULTISPECIES: hypothetical protein [unclassified Maridesulfovibrio]|uniref:hypothetical protein n=1 Tax=unclassified Maridesulfovibrio TaxID=2794999 RepID=UPI003B3E0F9B